MLQITIKYIPFVFLVVNSFFSNSQILDTNTIWSENNVKYSYISNDTVSINNKVYHYINSHSDTLIQYNSNVVQTYLVSEDGNKVFWREPFLNKDFLLYDFSLSIGDSIYVTPRTGISYDSILLYCENVDTLEIMGNMRKRLTMKTINASGYYDTDIEYWYEGIGSDLGLFNSGHLALVFIDQVDPKLFCCHKLFDQIYQDSITNSCHGTGTASIDKESLLSQINVYPNPVIGNTFNIQTANNTRINRVNLYDNQGKKYEIDYTISNTQNFCTVQTNLLSSGLYIVEIVSDSGYYRKKLILN